MSTRCRRVAWMLLAVATCTVCLSCSSEGPPSTDASGTDFKTLQEKVDFLQRYVQFRRTYETLDFQISFENNSGGMVPGPSEWDIRLVATVPATELSTWIPQGVSKQSMADREWLATVPTSLDLSGLGEWYVEQGQQVAIDRENRIVAYRCWAN